LGAWVARVKRNVYSFVPRFCGGDIVTFVSIHFWFTRKTGSQKSGDCDELECHRASQPCRSPNAGRQLNWQCA